MSKQEILDYLQKTPYNTNVNVVATMLDSVVPITTQVTADSTDEEVPSAKAMWNQAVKYTKVKRFLAHTSDGYIVMDSNTTSDVYNAINAGQVVTIFNQDTQILYTITRAFIDAEYQINISGESSHILENDEHHVILYSDYIWTRWDNTGTAFYNITKTTDLGVNPHAQA